LYDISQEKLDFMLETGLQAPPFVRPGLDGRDYSFPDDVGGQPALLVFFKTTCGTCDLAFPYIQRLPQAYPDGWLLWALSQDAADRTKPYAGRFGFTFPVLIDAPDFAASTLYDPAATPSLFLVDPAGAIEYATYGFAKEDLNEIATRIAAHTGAPPKRVAEPGDGKPDFKPG
jgi:peroxiredoxin